MITVQSLTKRYGAHTAIEDVSFHIEKGEVVGFLGPNGAGKTTTMRILCGCLGATSGKAAIGGHDILEDPTAAKRRIGYLPEVPPLYGGMVVQDYVAFAARIRGVDDAAGATARVIERVDLADVRHRVIDHLSKGYRQRVGLAQALVHDPDVLVLDEPTSGLDIGQRDEIKRLLRELAEGDRSVILSTHILSEIEDVCERVIIINQGRLVAADRIAALEANHHSVSVTVARPPDDLTATLQALSGVRGVRTAGAGTYEIDAERDLREDLARACVPFGLLELTGRESLEDVYLRLTSGGPA